MSRPLVKKYKPLVKKYKPLVKKYKPLVKTSRPLVAITEALNDLFYGILHNQSCQHHAENGSDVNDAAVAFVVRVYGRTIGTHHRLILQKFVGKDALELTLWKLLVAFETIAKGTGKGVARHLPKLSGLDTCRVELEGCPHR